MPAYVTLFNFTEQGIRNVKESPNRAREAAQAAQSMGGRFIGVWWLLGQYDGLVIIEAPDDETATRLLLATGMQGNVRTMTMRAFSEEEMARIVQGLGG
ncbi:MAG TPA: GYD domain-containing protein [Caldilineaceae bacterium]|nr:GYD domain-containing protein [Caldilineaceae bacterium]